MAENIIDVTNLSKIEMHEMYINELKAVIADRDDEIATLKAINEILVRDQPKCDRCGKVIPNDEFFRTFRDWEIEWVKNPEVMKTRYRNWDTFPGYECKPCFTR